MLIKKTNVLNAILYIVMGILFCVCRASVLDWMLTAIGAVMIAVGIIKALKKDAGEGIITAIIGIVVIFGGWAFVDVIFIILGAALAIKGVFDLLYALKIRNIVSIIASAVTIGVGIMLIISKWAILNWFFLVLGVILIIDGILTLFGKQ